MILYMFLGNVFHVTMAVRCLSRRYGVVGVGQGLEIGVSGEKSCKGYG
jgi:hypothetical protein